MSTACQICGGAIPHKEEQYTVHTALCVEVVRERFDLAVAALELIAGVHGKECADPFVEADKALRLIQPDAYNRPTPKEPSLATMEANDTPLLSWP